MGKSSTGVRPPKPFRGPVSLQYAFAILKANVAIFHPLKTISEWTPKQGEARHRMHFHVRDRTNFTVKSVPFFSLPVSYLGVTPVESGTGRGVGTQNEGLQFSRVVIKTLDTQKSFSIFSLSAPCLRRPFNSRFSLSLSLPTLSSTHWLARWRHRCQSRTRRRVCVRVCCVSWKHYVQCSIKMS